MNTQQALEVLEEYQSIRLDDPDFYDDWRYTQALTIAIAVMEATQSLTDYLTEQAKTTESRELANIFTTRIRGLNNHTK